MNKKINEEDLSQIGDSASTVITNTVLKEFISMNRWKSFKRWVWFLIVIGIALFAATHKLSELGYEFMPSNDVIGVVPIKGVVADGKPASAEAVIPIIRKLFETPNIKGIILDIKSGGGSPNESERIYKEIEKLKAETGKSVIAVCDSMCASAAYMLAIRGDKVYAGEYTVVGSIGAIMQGWDLSQSIKMIDAGYRIIASGKNKSLINPYTKLKEDNREQLQRIVDDMANIFKEDVISVRGEKLSNSVDLFTGNVWTGSDAQKYGLVDDIMTIEEAAEKHFPGIKTTRFLPRPKKSDFLDRVFGYFDQKIESAFGSNSSEVEFIYQ